MSRATILLVDAEPALREAVVRVLATIPRVRLQACKAADLPQTVEGARPAAVLLGGEPALSGEVLPEPRSCVAAISLEASRERELSAMRAGVDAHFALPEMADALAEWLRPLLVSAQEFEAPALVARSAAMQGIDRFVSRIARSAATVFVTGESGVGKEVLARQLHARSPRSRGPFEAINCAALPEAMLEAMLFGHAKGAFTGALEARPGKFQRAHGGTLLLDEVTEIPVHLQAKLLRALQEREVEPLGGRQAQRVDVRVIATSNRDLREAVAEGHLREDLYYRLNVFPLCIPPLRERPEDIVPLAQALLRRLSRGRLGKLDAAVQRRLREHDWPGNVRELANVMERAITLHEGDDDRVTLEAVWLDADMLAPWSSGDSGNQAIRMNTPEWSASDENPTPMLEQTLQTQESRVILNVLRESGGRRKEAADRLGISPRTLRYKIARLRENGFAVPASG
ncbi:sigma-54-dependent Fis family transcriptional regulator [Thioalkalivibrio sp. ALE28]|uniref:sigma-54 interaction domain-containing protein n=1 Tax=Thioalkalivibrio sp. ALE28 TaxID=1158179 RepID=UPI00035D50E8|nr:sigma-54-dependent Fis family transcriptional regulator [Thioalkalivibrio sp. ALE28]